MPIRSGNDFEKKTSSVRIKTKEASEKVLGHRKLTEELHIYMFRKNQEL